MIFYERFESFQGKLFQGKFLVFNSEVPKSVKGGLGNWAGRSGGCNDKFGLRSPFYCFNVK